MHIKPFIALVVRNVAAMLALGLISVSVQADTVRDEEIRQCLPGEISIWPDGRDRPAGIRELRIDYRHTGAPGWFSAQSVTDMIERAARAWSACGIAITLGPGDGAIPPVVIEWSHNGSRGNFGLTDLRRRTLSLGPQAFALLRSRNPAHDAGESLQMTISHEMGHFLGMMAHSRRCVDVLSYYGDDKGNRCFTRDPAGMRPGVDYRHVLPTACDIQRCRRVNGL